MELPQVIEPADIPVGVVTNASEEPKTPAAVGPARSGITAARDVACGGRSQDAVHSWLAVIVADGAAPPHPGPFVWGGCLRRGRQREHDKDKQAETQRTAQQTAGSGLHRVIP